MPTVTPATYIPILYTKRGELNALSDLDAQASSGIVPLFVVHAVDWDFEKEEPRKTVSEHLDKVLENLLSKWSESEAFVDAQYVGDTPLDDGKHPLQWIHERVQSEGRTLTPVTSVDRSAAHQRAVQGIVASGTELCIRLSADQWMHATERSSDLFALIGLVGAPRERTHLIFDAGSSVGMSTGALTAMVLKNLVAAQDWASISVASSSMPASMPGGDGLHRVDRPEWPEYRRLTAASLPRTPAFADYGIQSPDAAGDVDPRLMSPSNNLRFLADDYWYIPKAGQIRKGGSLPLVGMLRLLVTEPVYVPGYSACETWIDRLVNDPTASSAGNSESWRRYGTVRHITRSVELISTVHGTSASPGPGPEVP